MALVTTDFNINITPGAMPQVVHVSEYDIGRSYTVGLIGENNDTFTIPTGTTATIEGTLNGVVGFSVPATISNNKVAFTLTESMTAYAGKAWCKIKLTLNDEPIQTCAFILAVDRAGVESETVIRAPGFEEQIKDAVDEWLNEHGGGALPPGGKAGQVLVSDGQGGGNWATWSDTSGLTTAQINALDGLFKIGAYTEDASSAYATFKAAFGIADSGGETEVTLTSISATYSGGDVAVGTAVTDLTGIVITAHYSDGTSATVTGYTLSGTIAEGENTITVTYQGKSTTFTVNGIAEPTVENNGWTNGVAYDIKWTDGYSLDGTGPVEDKDLSVSDFLPCQNVSRMVTGNLYTNYRLYYYDADKNFLRRAPMAYVVNETNIETYRDAYYVRTVKRIATTNASIVPYRDDLLDADTAWEANKYYRLNWIDNHSELALCYGASALQFSNASRSFITWYGADKNEIDTVIRQNATTAVSVPNDAFYFSIANDTSGANFWVQLS